MAKTRNTGLGRGLDAIFIDNAAENSASNGVTMLRLSEIEPRRDQPRRTFDAEALKQLADSIALHGLIQPIVVREAGGGFYQIIAGERRYRAAKLAGLTEVPVLITEADDRKTDELALIENIQRENLNAMEEARAVRTLLDRYGLTQEDLSARLGRSRSALANSVRLLDLPDDAAELVASGTLSAGHARTLLGLRDRRAIGEAAALVIEKDLSVRETEALVRRLNRPEDPAPKVGPVTVDYAADLASRMTSALGRRVKITEGRRRKLEIEYADNDDLNRLIAKLCGPGFLD